MKVFAPAVISICALAACAGGGETATPTTSTTIPTTTTTPPTPGELLCDVLDADSYEARKTALDDYRAEHDEASAPCGDAIDELDATIVIERRAADLHSEIEEVLEPALDCRGRSARFTGTNITDHPIGVVGAIYARTEDDVVTAGTGFVIWRIPPGGTMTATHPFNAETPKCSASYTLFARDESDLDAALPASASDDAQDSDDPAVWFPALIEQQHRWDAAPDRDGVADFEDIRSPRYTEIVAEVGDEDDPFVDRESSRRICSVRRGPDGFAAVIYRVDLGAFSYLDDDGEMIDLPAESATQIGAFRRGRDGRWRWLHTSRFVSPEPCVVDEGRQTSGDG